MEVAWHSVDFKESLHAATLLGIDILNDLIQDLLVVHAFVTIEVSIRQYYLLQTLFNVHQMHFQYVFNVKRKERARVARKLNVEVHFQLLSQMFLVYYQVAIDLWRREVDNRHYC